VRSIRVRVIARIHEVLAEKTVRVLGEAYYPLAGQDAGYTWALVVDAPGTSVDQLMNLWEAAFRQSCAEHDGQSAGLPSPLAGGKP
jgi:hypothetical protein